MTKELGYMEIVTEFVKNCFINSRVVEMKA